MSVEPSSLGDLVPIDHPPTEQPEPCSYCPGWRFAWVDTPDGDTVLRQWHLPECAEVTQWNAAQE